MKPKSRPYEVKDSDLKGFGVRVQPTGTSTYFCDYRLQNGRRNRITIGRTNVLTPAQARSEAKVILGEVSQGLDPARARKSEQADTLKTFLENKYEPWVRTHRKTGKESVRRIRYSFPELMHRKLQDISAWYIEKWRMEKLRSGLEKATVNRNLAMLKACLSKAVEWEIIEHHPISKVKLCKVDGNKKVRYLSNDERSRLIEALDKRDELKKHSRSRGNQWRETRGYQLKIDLSGRKFADYLKPMVLLTLNTGLRQGELFSLRWADFNEQERSLTIRGTHGKSGKTHIIPLNRTAFDLLINWRTQSDGDLIFPGENGQIRNNIRRAWVNLLKVADIKNFRWHDMRHDFASQLVMRGVELNTIRELLGHSDLKMTLIYAHLSPKTKMDAVKKLDSIDSHQLSEDYA